MSKSRPNLFDNPKLLRHLRDLCPKEGGDITSVSFSLPGHKPVTLTAKTRKRLNARLRSQRRARRTR